MIYFEVTDMPTINYFMSIMLNMSVFLASIFGALALVRH